MNTYQIQFTKLAGKQLKELAKSGQKISISIIEKILDELVVHPREGKGKPERLKFRGNGEFWSRRIDQKNRMVYQILEPPEGDSNYVIIISTLGHYSDK